MLADAAWVAVALLAVLCGLMVGVLLKLDAIWRGRQPRPSRAQQRLDELGQGTTLP